MRYKIDFEPAFEKDCLYIIMAIINDEPIINAMEKIVNKRGTITRQALELLFRDTIELEKYVKNNLHFNFPGYEENGRETADFLFKKRERTENAPVAVVYFYNQLKKHTGEENLKMVILEYLMEGKFFNENWDDALPVIETDKEFFDMLEENLQDAVEKYEMIKFYYNFDFYHSYTMKLLENATALYKEKFPGFGDAIAVCMTFIEERLNEKGADFLKDEIGITMGDDFEYTVVPSVYHINSLSMQGGEPHFPVHLIVGIHLFNVIGIIGSIPEFESQNLQEFLKCVADSTKLSILRLLKEKPMYGSQLAEELKLTGATISHHLSAMLNLEIIYMEKKANRVYCSLNREKIEQYLNDAKTLIL